MTGRVWRVGGLVLLGACGCLHDDDKSLLVAPSPFGKTAQSRSLPPPVPQAPATEEAAKRVALMGRRLVDANPQMALRPTFTTVGTPQPEVFHLVSGAGPRRAYQLVVSEGLVKQCKTDAQLAAVLAHEMGKMVSEREGLVSSGARAHDRPPPPEVRVGNDSGGSFGAPDGTRYAELAKMDKHRQHAHAPPLPPPSPEVLARAYLKRAGFEASDLGEVVGLLREAEKHAALERQLKGDPAQR